MGTYAYIWLKDRSEENIKKVNMILEEKGIWKTKIYDGIHYGAFVTMEQLKEDARFMNEDPEGIEQAKHWTRPITPEVLMQMFWNKPGLCCHKLSGGTEKDILIKLIMLSEFCKKRNLIDTNKSRDWTAKKIKEYL